MDHPTDPPPARHTPATHLCCHCGQLTRQPVLIDEVHTPSGEGRGVYACPEDAPRFADQPTGPAA
ncbi:hypothetical protein [Streptomyces sp. PsTaAH-124]|uniref:hypothetical protein n=1 Tax=Streptomyces sp. PsTaAH-124 TaxID=1157638 RepID=UPI0003A263A7|nr:hypothetical protein [Streptomyces sp. PsTaAH-124]